MDIDQLCKRAWPKNTGYTDKQRQWLLDVLAPVRSEITDLHYMQEALVQMLGPKGREVWAQWQAEGVKRIHSSWAVDPMTLNGEEVAEVHLQISKACKNAEDVHDPSPDSNSG